MKNFSGRPGNFKRKFPEKEHHRSTEEDILRFAANAINTIEKNGCTLDDLLDRDEYKELRRTLSHLLLSYFKHKKAIDAAINTFCSKTPDAATFALLKASLTQAMTQQRIAPQAVVNVAVEVAKKRKNHGFVNAVLRRAVETLQKSGLPEDPEKVLPDELLNKWQQEFSYEETKQLTEAFLSTPDFTFRMENQVAPESFEFSCAFTIDEKFPFGMAKAHDVLESAEFKSGKIYIQDPAASLAVHLAPDESFENILDLCSAPGGKSLMLLEKYPDVKHFIAFDRSPKRHRLTAKNFELRNIKHPATCDRKAIEKEWDLILVDAPCSNTGVFRRRPDALWRFSRNELEQAAKIQKELLEFASSHLAVNGYILYSTCSIEPLEDEQQISDFLKTHKNFTCIKQEKLLPRITHDGAFCAVLKKICF
ncbi:MAG: RsmB/NOP family class I SAM-dependent RNA methyltransferase [Lentisphaeria bacterium]|nr:RsmB/NOP family class I SAM-dependent RNA methyltransferase [Lentisphaeria bacterium]